MIIDNFQSSPISYSTQEFSQTPRIPEPLNSVELVALVSEMYSIAGPRIGAILVEANNVLTIAGARGQTDFFIDNPTSEDTDVIERISAAMSSKGVWLIADEVMERSGKDPFLMVSIQSARGYERVSRLTQIPGIHPFDSTGGLEGIDEWKHKTFQNLEEEWLNGNIPYPKAELRDILAGVRKGYPDRAIYDATQWWGVNDKKTPIAASDIKWVSKYGGAVPNFHFHPDHANDPSIQETIEKWGEILRSFYEHPWHQELSKDPDFIAARLAMKNDGVV